MHKLAVIVLSLAVLAGIVAGPPAAAFSKALSCKFTRNAQVDPIVAPGAPSQHLHTFFGNVTTDSTSTYTSMVGQATSCALAGETAAYWVPTMFRADGTVVPLKSLNVYYGNEPGQRTVTPFPADFRMVAGFGHHAFATVGTHANGFFGFTCLDSLVLHDTDQLNCSAVSGSNGVKLRVWFPMCGQRDASGKIVTDSPNHSDHVVYPVGGNGTSTGTCPSDHPVQLPRVEYAATYSILDCAAAGCYLSSDAPNGQPLIGSTMHADFWNTWDQPVFEKFIADCVNNPAHLCGP